MEDQQIVKPFVMGMQIIPVDLDQLASAVFILSGNAKKLFNRLLLHAFQANMNIDADKEKEMASRMKKGKFDFEDYLESMKQMRNMGGLSSILSMMPGIGGKSAEIESMVDEKQLAHMEAIVLSMTPAERRNPKLLNPSRKHRIARGAGVDISIVNRFIKQFEQSQKMMKQLPGMMGG